MIQYDVCAGEKIQAATGWWNTLTMIPSDTVTAEHTKNCPVLEHCDSILHLIL